MLSAQRAPSPAVKPSDDVSEMQDAEELRTANFHAAFTTGRFSDILIISHDHVYRLHRVMLMQSPFFRRLLLDETGSEVVVVEGSLCIEIGGDWRVVREGMDISLEDLYMPPSYRSKKVNTTNVLAVLPAACFLELESLARHCVSTILGTLARETVIDYAVQLERLRLPVRDAPSPYGPKHAYTKLFGQCLTQLSDAILSFLCGVINAGLCTDADAEALLDEHEDAVSAETLLVQLPLCWIRRVLESDLLCVPNEYERYELVKRVVKMRRVTTRQEEVIYVKPEGDQVEESQEDVDVSMWSEADTSSIAGTRRANTPSHVADLVTRNAIAAEGVFRLRSYVGSLLTRVVSSSSSVNSNAPKSNDRKRKRRPSDVENFSPSDTEEEEFVEAVEHIATPQSSGRRTPILRTPRRSPVISAARPPRSTSSVVHTHFGPGTLPPTAQASAEDTVMAGVFQTAIVYTYMTFPQLELVKKDGIVPDAVVLESFWMQAELMNGGNAGLGGLNGRGLPSLGRNFGKFRFAVEFRDIYDYFFGPSARSSSAGKGKGPSIYPNAAEDAERNAPKRKDIMISKSVVCAGLQYRVLLSIAKDEEEDKENGPTGSEALSPRRTEEPPTGRPVLRALLQRNKIGESKRNRQSGDDKSSTSSAQKMRASASTPGPSISYRIFMFNRDDFMGRRGEGESAASTPRECKPKGRNWDAFVDPVTACDFDGDGFVRGFVVPEPSNAKDAASGMWAVVVIDFK
ncbi:hypothetical protein PhCBS80983_g03820 [Powellomyces hirtus]|uniref:Uncharacterized protein n=1 Tax=Powellomyces hirtus TaxID=109895 RepID=A0A507E067_9FUNG|nr:hypothetical protein PhCBS80983_g03820 [Powellomyces hirtus]